MADINDLKRRHNKAIADARALVETAETEDRDFSSEEQEQYNRMTEDAQDLHKRIQRLQKQQEFPTLDIEKEEARAGKPDIEVTEEDEERAEKVTDKEAEYRMFDLALRGELAPADLRREIRALQVTTDTSGGFTQPPMEFLNRLIQGVDNLVIMRQIGTTKYSLPKAESLGAPALSANPADPTWTTELSIGSEDSTMAFSFRELVPHPLRQYIKVSKDLLRKSALDIAGLVADRLAYKTAVVQENAFLNGNGASQPLGIFTASAQGVNTGQDVSTGNTTSSITFDGLKEAKYDLNRQYWNEAVWIFHSDAIKQIDKLKDGEGRYIWQQSVVASQPDTLLGRPVYFSDYAPNTFSTGEYVGALFAPRHYWIVDSLDFMLERLDELYAGNNQTGFVANSETDGAPVLEEAFVRVTLG